MKRLTITSLVLLAGCLLSRGQAMIGSGSIGAWTTVANTNAPSGDVKKDYHEGGDDTRYQDMWNWYYFTGSFVASNSYTMHSLQVRCSKHGSPTGDIASYIFSDNAGVPGTVLTGGTGSTNSLASAPAGTNYWEFTGFTCSIVSGTTYWIVFNEPVYSTEANCLYWFAEYPLATGKVGHADALPTWTLVDDYRVNFQTYGQ